MSAVPVGQHLTKAGEAALPVDPSGSPNTNGAVKRQYLTYSCSVEPLSGSSSSDLIDPIPKECLQELLDTK